jgi:hypothetical protein
MRGNDHVWKCKTCGMIRCHSLRSDDHIVTYLNNPDAYDKNHIDYKNQTCEEHIADSVMEQ